MEELRIVLYDPTVGINDETCIVIEGGNADLTEDIRSKLEELGYK